MIRDIIDLALKSCNDEVVIRSRVINGLDSDQFPMIQHRGRCIDVVDPCIKPTSLDGFRFPSQLPTVNHSMVSLYLVGQLDLWGFPRIDASDIWDVFPNTVRIILSGQSIEIPCPNLFRPGLVTNTFLSVKFPTSDCFVWNCSENNFPSFILPTDQFSCSSSGDQLAFTRKKCKIKSLLKYW